MKIGPGSLLAVSDNYRRTNFKHWACTSTFSFSTMYYLVLYQLTSYYGDFEFLGCVVQPLKIARAVIGATVVKVGISNGDFGVLITVLESMVIPIVDHLLDSPVPPAMASDVKGLIVYYHLSRGLKEQPI